MMTLFKIQNMKTKEVKWAKNRIEIQNIICVSKPTITRMMHAINAGGIGKSGSYIVAEVPVEVKEVIL